ncbi:MAG: heme ABC exporter ATP-binding protein CcmA [Pseudomonadota bacterium]|nr:heme ABC exporter ATP-binding protein CcmA [Pseudomonadota bacterium]
MNTLSVSSLSCVRAMRPVFRDIRFDLKAGEALVLTGPNGSGKSSLLRLLAGLLTPADGQILWNDASIHDDIHLHRTRVHLVGHTDALKGPLTVLESLTPFSSPEKACQALEDMGITHLSDTPVRLLSAGQKRRVALARTMLEFRPLWLLDEPAAALDSTAVPLLQTLIHRHRSAGGIVVLSTHGDLAVPDARALALEGGV